tara:strand:- start:349 stop:537 length:189 start_codon:yes stop_codon:yes gene_type:complete
MSSINYIRGNIFNSSMQTIVNTVNIVEPKYFSQLLCISEETKAFLQKNTHISVEVIKDLALY